jgi:hypothetical protein
MTETTSGAPGELVAYLRGAIGRDLESVIRYRADGHDHLYGEADSPPRAARAALEAIDRDRQGWGAVDEAAGPHRGTVHLHDDVLILHVPERGSRGVLITADPEGLPEADRVVRGAHAHLRTGEGNGIQPSD